MIEFSGYLTGTAEKRYFKKSIELTQYIGLGSFLIALLNYPTLAKFAQAWPPFALVMYSFYALCLLSPLWLRIPQMGKRRLAHTPNRVFIEDNFIVCESAKSHEGREASDVKTVRDFGEFYELVFPISNMGTTFICQKNLLTQGSLEEFEQLFEGKIVKMQ